MKREVQYKFRLRELMARAGMRNSRDLVEPLRDRGITISESQVYRLVGQDPERIAFQMLAALCDIFEVSPTELLTVTANDAQARNRRAAVAGDTIPLLDAYRPVRARIQRESDD